MVMAKQVDLKILNTYLERGMTREILDILGRIPLPRDSKDFEKLTTIQIAALVFSGEVAEAYLIYQTANLASSQNQLFRTKCLFYLGVGSIRRSDYAQAAKNFSENLNALRLRKVSGEEKFYIFQGVSFYKYFKGDFRNSNKYAQKAYEAAFSWEFVYGQILALDLLGHSLCQVGKIHRGLFELSRAQALTLKVGNGGIETALKVSIEKYKALFGINIETSVRDLMNAIYSLQPQDTYSRAELYLELVRQLILRGQGSLAQKKLEEAGEIVYQHANQRQNAAYNHRYSHLLLLRGERHAAQALARSLRSNLDRQVDHATFAQVIGLEEKINNQKMEITRKYVNFLDRRISQRTRGVLDIQLETGEDPMGDLIDQLPKKDPALYQRLKSLGLFGLLPSFFNIPYGASALLLGPGRSEIILFNGADVIVIDKGVTAPMKMLLRLINSPAFKSKEQLVEGIWRYRYNPRMHDNVLYALIGKTRKLLGSYSTWIEWSSDGYRLSPSVAVLEQNATTVSKSLDLVTTAPDKMPLAILPERLAIAKTVSDLNIRQMKALKFLEKNNQISVRDYSRIYKICKMTAYRDLATLHKRGHLIRIGKGRSIVYVVQPPGKE